MESIACTPCDDRVADEAHAAEFARDEEAGHVGLEGGRDDGEFDAALFRAEDQRDGLRGAGGGAGAVADAGGGVHHLRLAIDEADDGVLGTGRDAGAGAAAEREVDVGMQRRGLGEAGLFRFFPCTRGAAIGAAARHREQHQADARRGRCRRELR